MLCSHSCERERLMGVTVRGCCLSSDLGCSRPVCLFCCPVLYERERKTVTSGIPRNRWHVAQHSEVPFDRHLHSKDPVHSTLLSRRNNTTSLLAPLGQGGTSQCHTRRSSSSIMLISCSLPAFSKRPGTETNASCDEIAHSAPNSNRNSKPSRWSESQQHAHMSLRRRDTRVGHRVSRERLGSTWGHQALVAAADGGVPRPPSDAGFPSRALP